MEQMCCCQSTHSVPKGILIDQQTSTSVGDTTVKCTICDFAFDTLVDCIALMLK